MVPGNSDDDRLDELFLAYRRACTDLEAAADFIPRLWAKIEAREVSADWFGRVAKTLVTAALALSVILGSMISSASHPSVFFDATFVDALRADRMAALEPLHIERIAGLEPQ